MSKKSIYKNLQKTLKSSSPIPEKIMWSLLRNRRLNNYKFRRQVALGPYIVDFICLKYGLIIELDGSQHNEEQHTSKDQIRTKWLEAKGYKVMRFWNNELITNKINVLDKIIETIHLLRPNYPKPKK